MSDFLCDYYIKQKCCKENKQKMCYINADSFLLYIKTDNFYQDI